MTYSIAGVSRPTSVMVHAFSYEARSYESRLMFTAGPGSAAWGSANRAVYVPIILSQTSTFVKAFWINQATVNGNVDVGLYTEGWSKVASTGSTAQSGTSAVQEVDITDFTVAPGRYYLAFASSSATATFLAVTAPDANRLPIFGCAQEDSAFALPATATPAVISHLIVPWFGFSRRTLVG